MSLRTSGQLLLIGSIGLILANILQIVIPGPEGLSGPNAGLVDLVAVVAGLVALVGLSTLYRVHGDKVRIASRIGVAFLALGTLGVFVIGTAVQFLDVTFPGSVPHDRPHGPPTFLIIFYAVGAICYLVGGLVCGITSLRAHVLPLAVGWLLIVGAVLLLPVNVALPADSVASDIAQNAAVSLIFVAWAWAALYAMTLQQPIAASIRPAREY